jgi:hypothetical protein
MHRLLTRRGASKIRASLGREARVLCHFLLQDGCEFLKLKQGITACFVKAQVDVRVNEEVHR